MLGDPDDTPAAGLRLASRFQRSYADALLAGVPEAAELVIRDAIEAGLPEATIDDHVIRPAMRAVGDLWADGRITIAEEHLATSISLRVIALEREAFRLARDRAGHRVLLAGAQAEHHVVGLEMAASLLVHAGYDVRMLGPDLPVDEIPAAIVRHRPVVVGLTSATSLSAVHLAPSFELAREADPRIGLLVGGAAVHDAWSQGWGVTICRHVADAVDHVDAVLRGTGRN